MLKFLIALPSWGNKGAVFHSSGFEVSLVFWTGVFLSPGRRIRVTGKETGNECEIFNPVLNRSGYELYFLDSDKGERSSH